MFGEKKPIGKDEDDKESLREKRDKTRLDNTNDKNGPRDDNTDDDDEKSEEDSESVDDLSDIEKRQ